MASLTFPAGFLWGAATAAYQIEGAYREDDRGLSIWDTFAHQPGTIQDGSTGDVACDHYHRYAEDVDLMASIGLQAYRFSVSWSRVMPFGKGAINEKGLAFYDRLIDALLAKNIEPLVTLYHWDLPQSLQDLGGWTNRDVAGWFADYANLLFERYGDRVKKWVTLNEPYIFTDIGHRRGGMAPGFRDLGLYARAVHHAHLAHGRAVQAFRASGKGGEIGMTNANTSYEPADDTPETAKAVELARDFDTRLFHGPIFGKGYPQSVVDYHDSRRASFPIEPGDMEVIATPTDFLGLNLYSRALIQAGPGRGVGFSFAAPRLPLLPMGYEAAPHALGDFVRWVSEEYANPAIYITENGVCDNTEPSPDGQVHDAQRVELLGGFLRGLHGAIQDGCDVRGYFQWSLYDNYEWAFGYTKRFGMVYTDFESLKRIPKDSARWYSEVIRRNGLEG